MTLGDALRDLAWRRVLIAAEHLATSALWGMASIFILAGFLVACVSLCHRPTGRR